MKPVETGIVVGTVFQEKYRVDSILGQGGMGVVAACTHLQLNERVAIKMLRKDVLLDEEAIERFTREARAAARLKSEYVARVTDTGLFDGVPYMVMEFLEGLDLGQLLEQRGTLPVPWACELTLQTAEALAEAHSLGIVHRDIKPTNLFVTWRPDGSAIVKVLDFGISKSSAGTDMQLTQTQSLLGTPAYMSPEQMRSARLVDSRSDIWSLGSVLYELIEGHRPFEADSFSEMCVKVAVDEPAPMTVAPPALQLVILKCLAKAPEQRYANMANLGADLVQFVQDQHQGQKLVERMGRVLRRSGQSWDGDSAMIAPRAAGTDPAAPQWDVKSEPFVQPVRSFGSAPVATQDPRRTGVAAAAPSTVMETVRPKRRAVFIVAALGLLIGGGVAIAVVMTSSGTEPPAAATTLHAASQPIDMAAKPDPVVKPEVVPPEVVTPGAGSAAVASAVPPAPPAHPIVKPVRSTKTTTKKPLTAVEKATPVAAPKVDATVKPPASNCDPFSSMHNCDNK
jgi:tRNA A-37 threonylcarbamoyl transferase component Bud32